MLAELVQVHGAWIATFVPIAVLVGFGALIGSLWSRRRDR